MICIYSIINLKTNKFYIGSSFNVNNRKAEHFSRLKKGNHPNKHLQNSFNIYGENAFEFCILEIMSDISDYELRLKEQNYINIFKPQYNFRLVTKSNKGLKHSEETKAKMSKSQTGRIHSELTKEKMSKSHTGKKHSETTKLKMSQYAPTAETLQKCSQAMKGKFAGEKHPKAKLNEIKVNQIRLEIKNGVPYQKIANDFKVSKSTISLISNNKIWINV